MNQVYLSTAYLAPVEYYSRLLHSPEIIIEKYCNYVKQTYRNRCLIASANGKQVLSIPIEKPDQLKCLTKDIRIAEHGNWRHLHWQAIISAYNSSPFFEYYQDDFEPFFNKKYDFIFDFNEELRIMICKLIDFEPNIYYSTEFKTEFSPEEQDLREAIHPKKPSQQVLFKPYYQVFDQKSGFQPNLSIIDMLFNLGPETILYL